MVSPLPLARRAQLTAEIVATYTRARWVLERRRIPSALMIGVRGAPEFGAHAWIEYDGMPRSRGDESTFSRLVEFSPDGFLRGK